MFVEANLQVECVNLRPAQMPRDPSCCSNYSEKNNCDPWIKQTMSGKILTFTFHRALCVHDVSQRHCFYLLWNLLGQVLAASNHSSWVLFWQTCVLNVLDLWHLHPWWQIDRWRRCFVVRGLFWYSYCMVPLYPCLLLNFNTWTS